MKWWLAVCRKRPNCGLMAAWQLRRSLLLLALAARTISVAEVRLRVLSVCPDGGGDVFSRDLHGVVAQLRLSTRPEPVALELCTGRHALSAALVLGPSDAIHEIRGPADGLATLDSGVRISGWQAPTAKNNGLWQASLPKAAGRSRQLWINGVRATRAHANPTNCSGGPAYANMPLPPFGSGGACSGSFHAGTRTTAGYVAVPDKLRRGRAAANVSMTSWLTPGSELVFGRGGSGASWTEPRCTVLNVTRGAKRGTVDIAMAQPCWARATTKHAPEQDVTFPSDVSTTHNVCFCFEFRPCTLKCKRLG